jgi:hypothetical protein
MSEKCLLLLWADGQVVNFLDVYVILKSIAFICRFSYLTGFRLTAL